MKTVSKRVRQDGKTFFRFQLRDGKLIYESRYALTGRVWASIVSGVKALEFDNPDELDRLLFLMAIAYRTLDSRDRSAGFIVSVEEVSS